MPNWKAELNAYAGEVSVIAKALGIEIPPPASLEPAQASRVVSLGSQRDEIKQHVAMFKAHQQHLIKQREDFAARELQRMRASAFDQRFRHLPDTGINDKPRTVATCQAVTAKATDEASVRAE